MLSPNWRSQFYPADDKIESQIRDEVMTSKVGTSLGKYVFPGNTMEILLKVHTFPYSLASKYLVGIVIEYEDVHHARGEYGFIVHLHPGISSVRQKWVWQVSKVDEWFD
jgi:hypothetical protein